MNKWPSKKIFESDKKSKNLISVRTVLELGPLGLHFWKPIQKTKTPKSLV